MKFILTIFIISSFRVTAFTQQPVVEPASEINMNQLEESAEEEENETENDYDIQQLNYFIKHPLDINGTELEQLPFLDPLLINNLSAYRKLLGDIIDVHELQAVPGFTIEIIKSILPYVTVKKDELSVTGMRERFTNGEHSILLRPSVIPEIADGYRSSTDQSFTGSRLAFFLRYKYQFRNLLQYGFIADKDAGEKFFFGGVMPDFTSFHLFVRKAGIFKSLAFGDFTINLGQGLIHWQSQAFHKSSAVINIKRQSEVLRPYHSAGEYNFHRGVAATIGKRSCEATLFISQKKLTANVDDGVITSIITSGLHRTPAEVNDKNRANLSTAGGAVKQKFKKGIIGVNAVHYLYSLPLLKRDEPYNLYSIKGKVWHNYSADYAFTFSNFHFFGELATDKRWGYAFINGMMSGLSKSVDVTTVFRYITKSYQSVYGNAFTENSIPGNEKGFYAGVSIKPHIKWRVDIYADLFSFPWLKYRLDAPSGGYAYLIQVTWKPNKQTEAYTRLRYRLKPLNIEDEEELTLPGLQTIQHWRTHFSFQVSRSILLRSRVEVCLFAHQYLANPSNGYLFYTDVVCKPMGSAVSGNFRIQAFEGESYDARIYAYENDVLFVSSTPSFYNNGVRCYVNVKSKVKVKFLSNSVLTVSLKLATTVYNNISDIGSGPLRISGNRISAAKVQLILTR
jgi:hypothetical protein